MQIEWSIHEIPALIGASGDAATGGDTPDPGYLCLLSRIDGHLSVLDLGTKEGTFVNGERVRRATVHDADTLRFGGAEFRVRETPPARRYLHGVRN